VFLLLPLLLVGLVGAACIRDVELPFGDTFVVLSLGAADDPPGWHQSDSPGVTHFQSLRTGRLYGAKGIHRRWVTLDPFEWSITWYPHCRAR
jgi:hypothetical protein